MSPEQINSRLKSDWLWNEKWRGEQDDGFVVDGFIAIRGKTRSAALRGFGLFATLFYFTDSRVLKKVTV